MAHLFVLNIIIVVFLILCSSGYAQQHSTIDDRGEGTANHNYFAASQSPTLKELLSHVENFHLNHCPHPSREGPAADIRIGRLDEALGDLKYILERFVNHPKALLILGLVAKLKKTPLLPIPYYENALRMYPSYAITHAQYGKYLADIDRAEAGIAHLKKAIEMDPKLSQAYKWLAEVYARNGKSELARQVAEQAKVAGYKEKTTKHNLEE